MDLNSSIGPPSGVAQNNNEALMGSLGKNDSFKNPWTTIPRPMNRFMELNDIQWERQEKEKFDLQRILQDQIDEKRRRQEEEKKKQLMDEIYYEQKLKREMMDLVMKERDEREQAQQKIDRAKEQNK